MVIAEAEFRDVAMQVLLSAVLIDAMHPALSAERLTAAAPVRRLGIIYYFGGATDRWRPSGDGAYS